MCIIPISKLQTKSKGEADQATVRKLLDKMACDGYVEAKSRLRLGKRVIQSELTDKKLLEVKNALEIKLSAIEISEPQNMSTCGGLHSVAATRESGIRGNDKRNGVDGRGFINCGEGNDTLCSRSSQKKRSRKTSTVDIRS
ncbi:hypothetical protein MKX01_018403 [Papaver californicum]|nr:hypothetical protein MKX01_018403 [Papaver californicum]